MNKVVILAIDDTPESLALLDRILTPAGYQVLPADSGELALAAAAINPPDLILLDVRMKGMDGLEVCRRLKAAAETKHIPIILVSAFADVKEWVKGLQMGVADYISKPFQPEELLMRVSTHLALSRANVSLEKQKTALHQTDEQLQSEIVKRQRVEDELRQSLDQAIRSRRALLSAIEDHKRAEDSLRETRDYLNSLIGYANAPIITWDTDRRITKFNHAFEILTGNSAADMLGQNLNVLFPPESNAESLIKIANTSAGEFWDAVEIPIMRKNGEVRTVLWNSANVYAKDGKTIVATIAQGQDISERKRAEETLRETEAKFRQTFEFSPVGIVMVGLDKRFIRCNNAFSESVGYAPEELIGKTIADITYPDDIHLGMDEMKAVANGELAISNVQKRYLHKDGGIIWGEATISLIRDHKADPQYFMAIIQDISKRKRAEEALRESEDKFKYVFDNSVIGKSITLPSGEINVNKAFCSMLGYSAEEIKARKWQELTHPDDVEATQKMLDKILAGQSESVRFEKRYFHKNGSLIWADVGTTLRRDVAGKPLYFMTVVIDITERKQAEEMLRESEKKLRETQEMARLGHWSWDIKTGQVEWSEEVFRIFHLDPNSFTPQIDSILALSPWPEDHERDQELIRKAMETHEKGTYEQRFLRPDKSIGYYHSTFQGIYDDEGNLNSIIGTVLDISERKRAEEALAESEKKLRALFETMSEGIVYEDHAGNIISANPAAEKLLGLSLDQLQGRTSLDPRWKAIHEDGSPFPGESHSLNVAAKTGKSAKDEVMGIYNPQAGAYVWLSVNSTPEFLPGEKEPLRAFAVFRDITERKQAEETVRRSEARLRAILDATPFPIAIVDVQDDKIDFWSSSALALFGHTAPTATEWYELAYPDPDYRNEVIERWKPFLEKARSSGQSVNTGEYRVTCRDGSVLICELQAAFLAENLIVTFNNVTERKQAESQREIAHEALKREQSLTNVIINSIPGAFYVLDENGRYTRWNAYQRDEIIGKPEDQVAGANAADTIHPDDRELIKARIANVLGRGREETVEGRVLLRGGPAYRWLLMTGRQIMIEGKPLLVGIGIDISERKRAEEALQESERKFRETVINLDEGYYSVTLDGKLLEHNQAFSRILGFDSHEDLKGVQLPDFWQDPEQRKEYLKAFAASGSISNYQIEAKTQKGDKITILASAHLVKDENDRPQSIEGVFLDISERKRAEEALRLKNFVFDVSIAANSIADLNGIITEANDAFLRVWGYPRKDEVVGKPLRHFINDPDEAVAIVTALTSISQWEGDYTAKKKDGSTFIAHGQATTIKDEMEKVIGYQSAVLDVTEQREAEKELMKHRDHLEQLVAQRTSLLEAANKELEAFSYSVSHDLRAPLRAIDGFARIVLEEYAPKLDDEGRRLLGVITGNTGKMGHLIDDLLAFSRLSRQKMAAAQVHLDAMANVVFAELKSLEKGRRIEFKVNALPAAHGDHSMLQQVLQNLLANAVKFTRTRKPARIELGGKAGEGENIFYVKDNGVGFDMAYADKLFGVFHSADEFEGTGVGLAIVQRIVTRHGGRVWAESKGGKGATFYFSLPAEQDKGSRV
jgi:PAS domain S-box-containing protein